MGSASLISFMVGLPLADLLRNVFTIAVMVAVGLFVGYRPDGSAIDWLPAPALMLMFSFAISWVGARMALAVPRVEALQLVSFVTILPLTAISRTDSGVSPATRSSRTRV